MRKDRLTWLSGSDRLGEHRLTPDSPTRRFVTRCCNSPIALEFTKGHWLSVSSGRIPEGERPPAEMRTMVMGQPEGVELPGDIPNYKTPSGKFMRSEEHTSELKSLMRNSYAVFCSKK